jgi:hypothetical protein
MFRQGIRPTAGIGCRFLIHASPLRVQLSAMQQVEISPGWPLEAVLMLGPRRIAPHYVVDIWRDLS